MLVSWLILPIFLAVLSAGCGLLVETLTGTRLPLALRLPAGFCVIVVVGHATTSFAATAELTAPAMVLLAVAGLLLARGRPFGHLRADGWTVAAALGVFVVTGAPVIASGEPTFAGYIKLDDTATWLALTDRVMEHGHEVDSLADSSYEATLDINLAAGYPVGAFVPLGVGAELTGSDPAWLVQPYMSFAAALLALAISAVLAPLGGRAHARALIAFLAAQPAILVGYLLWGGIKEVIAAAILVAIVGGLVLALERGTPARSALIPALGIGALLAILSAAGAIWVVPVVLGAVLWGRRRLGPTRLWRRLGLGAAAAVAFSLPLLVPALAGEGLLPPTSSSLGDGEAKGNLIEPLGLVRIAGIWPAGDFRLDPSAGLVTYALVALVFGLGAGAIGVAVRRGWIGPSLLALGIPAGALALFAFGSPWVDGKAIATASPAVLAAGCAGALLLARVPRPAARLAGGAALTAIGAGVLWSNALAYSNVNLAPYEQLRELEAIGELIAGDGPALMTEYQPYGVRHFLREADPEGASELRRRRVPLLDGETLNKGTWADTDDLDPAGLFVYRTLVLRRSPAQSRPPGPYTLIFSGTHYEVWQRPPGEAPELERIPFGESSGGGAGPGEGTDPGAVPSCERLERLAAGSRPDETMTYAPANPTVAISLGEGALPERWEADDEGRIFPFGEGALRLEFALPVEGAWTFWLDGSVRAPLELLVDGRAIGVIGHELNNFGLHAELGTAQLEAGPHRLELRYGGPGLEPGSGDDLLTSIGPLVAAVPPERTPIAIERSAAAQICGRRLDWIELD